MLDGKSITRAAGGGKAYVWPELVKPGNGDVFYVVTLLKTLLGYTQTDFAAWKTRFWLVAESG